MLETTLIQYNTWWRGDLKAKGIRREAYLDEIQEVLDAGRVAILFGLRRVGKTTLMRQYIESMVQRTGPARVLYASADHPDVKNTSIIDLVETFRSMHKIRADEKHVLVLDEIHYRRGFESELKVLNDMDDGLDIVAAGSSSLVVRHRSAAMTGRYGRIHVRPLSFGEYLEFIGERYDPSQPLIMASHMDDYLRVGGMPEYVLERNPQHILELVDDIIYKDISTEYELRDPALLKDLFFLLMDRIGRRLSYTKMGKLVDLGPDAAKKYVGYFENTYLLQMAERHGSPNVRKRSPKKCYCPDNGIRVVAAGEGGVGALAENLVYNLLRQAGEVRYLASDEGEVDFLAGDIAVEVKYKDTLEDGDIAALSKSRARGVKSRVVVTRRGVDAGMGIVSIPLWKLAGDGFERSLVMGQ